jgi:hypothetical protein
LFIVVTFLRVFRFLLIGVNGTITWVRNFVCLVGKYKETAFFCILVFFSDDVEYGYVFVAKVMVVLRWLSVQGILDRILGLELLAILGKVYHVAGPEEWDTTAVNTEGPRQEGRNDEKKQERSRKSFHKCLDIQQSKRYST